MSYNKTTWRVGDTITSEKLNNIENGIEAASKQVTTTHIVNNSTCRVTPRNCYVLIDGVLYEGQSADVLPNSTADIVTLPFTGSPVLEVWLNGLDSSAAVTSDTFDCVYDNAWLCTIDEPPIPDNLSITISDLPLGEERTISLQSAYMGGVPETITGRVNEWVYIDHVSSGMVSGTAYAFYDASTQNGVQLFVSTYGEDYLDFMISFRIPSTDVVSDTGYIKIIGQR